MGFFIDEESGASAGIEASFGPPKGFFIDEEVDNRPSLGESSKFALQTLAQSGGKVLDLVNAFNIFTGPSTHPGEIGTEGQDLMGKLFGKPEGIEGPAADFSKAAIDGAVFPLGNPIMNAVTSVGAEAAHKAFPDSSVAPFMGALATSGAASVTQKLSKAAIGAGKAFERSSVGASARDYIKSQKVKGNIEDAEVGEIGNRLSQAINEIGDKEGFGILRDPQRLASRNAAVMEEAGGKIGAGLEAADAAGANAQVNLLDKGSNVQKLIDGANAEKAELKEGFNEFLTKFTDPSDGWDGTVKGLNAWKSSLGNMGFSGTAKGTLKPAVARKLQRALYADLQHGVDEAVIKSGAATEAEWREVMRTYSNHAELLPVLNPEIAKSLSSTWDKVVRGMIRTTGGSITTPVVMGTLAAGSAAGAVPGAAAGLALSALSTPTGQGITGNLLKAGGRAVKALTKDAPTSALAGVFSRPEKEKEEATKDIFSRSLTGVEKKDEKSVVAEIDSDPFDSTVFEIESSRGKKLTNKESTAKGAFQLINKTAKSLGVADAMDLEQNYAGFKKLKEENKQIFNTENPELLYSAHYLGATLLRKVIAGKQISEEDEKKVKTLYDVLLPRFRKIYESKLLEA